MPTFGGSGGGVWSAGSMKLWRERVWAPWSVGVTVWVLLLTWCFLMSDWGQKESKGSENWSTVFTEYEMWYNQWAADVCFVLTYPHHHNHHLSLWSRLYRRKHQEGINVYSYFSISIYVRRTGGPHTWADSCCSQSVPAKPLPSKTERDHIQDPETHKRAPHRHGRRTYCWWVWLVGPLRVDLDLVHWHKEIFPNHRRLYLTEK